MGKKKQKKKGRAAAAAELTQEEAREELLALEAIFGEDIALREDGPGSAGLGFTLRVVPHPGEAAANYAEVTLVVSFPDDYPSEELSLKLTEAASLTEPAVRQLSKALHQAAQQYAAEGEVCCFQLITLAQEFLQQHNHPPEEEEESGGSRAQQSLWHEMQMRDLAQAAESREQSFRAPAMGDAFFDSLDGGGLFSDAADLPVGPAAGGVPHATGAVPVVEVRSSSKVRRPPKPPRPAPLPVGAAGPGAASSAAAAAAATEPSRLAASHSAPAAEQAAGQAAAAAAVGAAPAAAALTASSAPTAVGEMSTVAALETAAQAAAAAAAAAAAPLGTARQATLGNISGSSPFSGAAVQAGSGISVGGGGGSLMKTLGASIRGVLPRGLRKYLDGGSGATPEGSEAGEAVGPLESTTGAGEDDRALIRQELFLGHLLTLADRKSVV